VQANKLFDEMSEKMRSGRLTPHECSALGMECVVVVCSVGSRRSWDNVRA
jgi:hypothetical protein